MFTKYKRQGGINRQLPQIRSAINRARGHSARGFFDSEGMAAVVLRTFVQVLGMLLALATAMAPAAGAQEIIRPTTAESVFIGRALFVLRDESGRATLADVMGPLRDGFRPAETDQPTSGISTGAIWTKISVDLSADPARLTRRAQFSALHPDTASFFVVNADGAVVRTYHGGITVPGSTTHRKFSMPLGDLGPGPFTLYARITTHFRSVLGQFLITAQEETEAEMALGRVLGPLFGAILLAMCFCVLLWAYMREKVYGYGFGFIAAIFVGVQVHLNVGRAIWPLWLQHPDITNLIYSASAALVPILGLLFSAQYLDVAARAPGLYRAVKLVVPVIALAHLYAIVANLHIFQGIATMGLLAAAIMIALMLTWALRAGVATAKTYAAIALPVLACFLLSNAAGYGLIARHPIWISMTATGLTLLSVGITVALADGFRRNLETKVAARTAELSAANDALREAHEAKNRMLGVVAHDLRNPLSGIRAAAQLLIEIPLDAEKRQSLLRTIRDGADVTLGLTEDLLDVTAIRDGKVELSLDAIDLAGLIESRAELFRIAAQAKDITLDLDVGSIPPVWADAKRTAQVLDNLVSNAVKYSPWRGRVLIELRAVNGRARLSVVDQGPGIPAHELDDIFEPFERASTRPTGGERSIGLGLAIVKRLIQAQAGEVQVQSTPGKGSRFDLFLPFATAMSRTPAGAPGTLSA